MLLRSIWDTTTRFCMDYTTKYLIRKLNFSSIVFALERSISKFHGKYLTFMKSYGKTNITKKKLQSSRSNH